LTILGRQVKPGALEEKTSLLTYVQY